MGCPSWNQIVKDTTASLLVLSLSFSWITHSGRRCCEQPCRENTWKEIDASWQQCKWGWNRILQLCQVSKGCNPSWQHDYNLMKNPELEKLLPNSNPQKMKWVILLAKWVYLGIAENWDSGQANNREPEANPENREGLAIAEERRKLGRDLVVLFWLRTGAAYCCWIRNSFFLLRSISCGEWELPLQDYLTPF